MENRAFKIHSIERRSMLRLDDFITWGGSMTRTTDGKCHLYFSLWPRMKGHNAWVTDSEVGYAVADDPLGPYTFSHIALQGSGKANSWDRDVIHNPTIQCFDGKFYLYYTGNKGNGEYWNHRNNQRIGVAVADNPEGPWQRFDTPVLDVSDDGWDCLITTNPSITRTADGKYVMVYKAGDKKAAAPMYGPILHGVAFADSPLGPFIRHSEPIFASEKANFPGEDPFIFSHGNKFYAILKDMNTFYTSETRALVLFESEDAIDWHLTERPIVATRNLRWSDGETQEFFRLERPQLYLEDGIPSVLFAAVKPEQNEDDSYNIHFKIEQIFS